MAIRIIQGVPGSGKTYYAVRHLAENYFERQQDGRYELIKPCTIITNIDSFQPEHVSLQAACKEAGGFKEFFTEEYQRQYSAQFEHQIIYLIDEAQKLFRKNARDLNDVFTYFELHRHLGHDIYLITQNAKKLSPDLVLLTEYIIEAAPRSRSVIGEFKYKWLSDGEVLKREGFRPDEGVFALYKSMDVAESEKISNPVMKTFWMVIFVCAAVIGLGVYFFKSAWHDPNQEALAAMAREGVEAVQPAPAPAPSPEPVKLREPQQPDVTVRVDSATFFKRYGDRGRQIIPLTYLYLGSRLYRLEMFPYPVERSAGGEFYATMPRDVALSHGLLKSPTNAEPRRLRSDLSEAGAGAWARLAPR